jgi:hypothetical protein
MKMRFSLRTLFAIMFVAALIANYTAQSKYDRLQILNNTTSTLEVTFDPAQLPGYHMPDWIVIAPQTSIEMRLQKNYSTDGHLCFRKEGELSEMQFLVRGESGFFGTLVRSDIREIAGPWHYDVDLTIIRRNGITN